jgi:hypothetical protein
MPDHSELNVMKENLMSKLRMYIAATSIAVGVTLVSASLIEAKPKGDNRTPREKCDDGHDICRLGCDQLAGAENRAKCLNNCDYNYVQCATAAGKPRPPIKAPTDIPLTTVPTAGNAQKSTSKASLTPSASASASPKTGIKKVKEKQ